MSFRAQPKAMLQVRVPSEIEIRIREASGGAGRRSLSEVATELLCTGLALDPRTYGITPCLSPGRGRRSRRNSPATS